MKGVTMSDERLAPVHPGEVLLEDALVVPGGKGGAK
jgi:hypothetical protein